jgi:hypothetical protein
MLEELLAVEEKHADDLRVLIEGLGQANLKRTRDLSSDRGTKNGSCD